MPRAASIAGKYALTSIWIIVTKLAIMVIKAGILTLSGITLRRSEITRLEPTRTSVAATPIPIPLMAAVVIDVTQNFCKQSDGGCGYCKCGAGAKHQTQNRIFLNETVGEIFKVFTTHLRFPPVLMPSKRRHHRNFHCKV